MVLYAESVQERDGQLWRVKSDTNHEHEPKWPTKLYNHNIYSSFYSDLKLIKVLNDVTRF